jgi:hypothetical protein
LAHTFNVATSPEQMDYALVKDIQMPEDQKINPHILIKKVKKVSENKTAKINNYGETLIEGPQKMFGEYLKIEKNKLNQNYENPILNIKYTINNKLTINNFIFINENNELILLKASYYNENILSEINEIFDYIYKNNTFI